MALSLCCYLLLFLLLNVTIIPAYMNLQVSLLATGLLVDWEGLGHSYHAGPVQIDWSELYTYTVEIASFYRFLHDFFLDHKARGINLISYMNLEILRGISRDWTDEPLERPQAEPLGHYGFKWTAVERAKIGWQLTNVYIFRNGISLLSRRSLVVLKWLVPVVRNDNMGQPVSLHSRFGSAIHSGRESYVLAEAKERTGKLTWIR